MGAFNGNARCDHAWSDDLISPSCLTPSTPFGVRPCSAQTFMDGTCATPETASVLALACIQDWPLICPYMNREKVNNVDRIDRSSSVVSSGRRWLGLFALSTVAPSGTLLFTRVPVPILDRFRESPEPHLALSVGESGPSHGRLTDVASKGEKK